MSAIPLLLAVCVLGPSAPHPWERTAQDELRQWCPKIDGASGAEEDVVFHVGDTDLAKEKGLSSSSFADEEWAVRRFGKDIVLNGGGTRGCLYAVYHFLEDVCGIRWWNDEEFDKPEAACVPAELNLRGRPFFRYRQVFRTSRRYGMSGETAVRCRLNANGADRISSEWGGDVTFGSPYHVHTWDRICPFAVDGKTHPEWFALRDGRRVGGQHEGQLCLTAPGLVEAFAARVCGNVRRDREQAAKVGALAPSVYDLSMNDNEGCCQCEDCKREVAEIGFSGQQIRFANAVSREVLKTYPGLRFSLLAYLYSEPAPKGGVKPDDNIVVKLCNTRQNVGQSILHPDNAFMKGLVTDWNAVTTNLFVWEYFTTFGKLTRGFPYPSERAIVANLKYYADHGVKSVLVEHQLPERADWHDLKFYLTRRLLEDPTLDGRMLEDDFYARYLGPAAPYVRAAREHLVTIYDQRKVNIQWSEKPGDFFWIRGEDMKLAGRFFDQAAEAARNDEKFARRVRRARISYDLLAQDRKAVTTWQKPTVGVSELPFVDFKTDVDKWILYRKSDIAFVDDPTAANGKSVRLSLNTKRGFKFPLPYGCAVRPGKAGAVEERLSARKGDGWQWVSTPAFVFPEDFAYFYFTWSLQLHVNAPEHVGKTVSLKVHVRFEDDAAYVDRFVLECHE